MVKIKRGKSVLIVTAGAYKTLYKPAGYRLIKETEEERPEESSETPVDEGKGNNTPEENEAPEEPEDEGEDEESVTEPETPIGEMSLEELKEYGKRLGIRVKGMDKQELRKAIRKAINQ